MRCIVLLFALTMTWPATASAFEFDSACRRYQVPKALAIAIAQQESSMYPWTVNVAGKDFRPRSREEALAIIKHARELGLSHDIGLMQINSQWLAKLRLSPETVLEPQNNITLGVWILAQEIRRHGLNWRAIGAYHSPDPARARRYAASVLNRLRSAKGA
jgi:soluble lytic murein transglycosylase-like protein